MPSPTRNRIVTLSGSFRYDPDAVALFNAWNAAGVPASNTRKNLVNNTISAIRAAGDWSELDILPMWVAHAQGASLIDWKRPSVTMSVVGGMTFTTDSDWQGNGSTGRIDLMYNPGDGGTYKYTQDLNGFGVYYKTHTNETKVDMSCLSAGSVGSEIVSLVTSFSLNGKNNNGTARSIANFTNRALQSTKRTGASAWEHQKNGYDMYSGGSKHTDASQALNNLNFQAFCRNVNGTYSQFSSKRQCYVFAGGNINHFRLNYTIEKYFLNPLGLIPTKRVTFNGNSFTATGDYQKQFMISLGSYDTVEVQSRGISGQTTTQMTTDATTTVFPMVKSFLTKNVHFVWELTNDFVFNGGDATACYNNLVTHCQALRVAQPDAIIIVATMLPRTGTTDANRVTLNGLVNGNAAGAWDYICDVASDLNMGQAGQYADTTYYNVDGIHPNTNGYNYLAINYIYPSINAVL